jgi:hypothetical protein
MSYVTKSFCNYVRNEDRKIKSLELQLTESNNENNILKDNLIVAKRNTYLLILWRYSSCRTPAASRTLCEVSLQIFTGWGCQPHTQPPTWKKRNTTELKADAENV